LAQLLLYYQAKPVQVIGKHVPGGKSTIGPTFRFGPVGEATFSIIFLEPGFDNFLNKIQARNDQILGFTKQKAGPETALPFFALAPQKRPKTTNES
jgi:hypothetical protein